MERGYLTFLNNYIPLFGNIEGLNKELVANIENDFKVILPISYKEYLYAFGKESGNMLNGYYTEFPSLLENRKDAISVINFDDRKKDYEKPSIKSNYFFFAQWQGYVFYFFECSNDNNPSIYILTDGLKIEKYKDSFTDFINDEGLKPILENIKL